MSPSRRALSRIAVAFFMVAASGFIFAPKAGAQNSSRMGTPAEAKTGQSGVSTYARDKIETVNLANGNLSLSLPLATIGGRGSASYTVALSYNSKVWTAQHDVEDFSSVGGIMDTDSETPGEQGIHNLYTAVYEKLEEAEPGLWKLGGGWSIRLAPGIKALTFGINPSTVTNCTSQSEEPPKCGYRFVLTKMWLTLPDGSQVELRDLATQGTPAVAPVSNGFNQSIDRDRGRLWQSIDGSGVTFVRDAGYAVGAQGLHFPSGWVFMGDGTRMRMDQGVTNKIIDRNGNFIDVVPGTYTDELGRQTLLTSTENAVTVTVKGYLGAPDRSLTIQLGEIGNNLRSDLQSLPRPFTTGDAYRDSGNNYSEHTIQQAHTDLFLRSEGHKHYGSTEGEDIGAKVAVTRLNLLDGRSLLFRYNQYGEIAEVVYPGGGISQIDYAGRPSGICQLGSVMGLTFNRKVSERRTMMDGTNLDATWVYGQGSGVVNGVSFPTVSVGVHQGAANGALLGSETHSFLKLGVGSEYRSCQTQVGTGNERWDSAKEFRTEIQTGTGTTVTTRNWEQRAPVNWTNDGYLQLYGQDQSSNDPRVTSEETTLENGKVKRVEYGYDDFNNVTSIKEYDFPVAGQPATLVRQTLRTYGSTINGNYGISNNGYCYSNLNPTDNTCGGGIASDVATIIYQRHLLLNETVKDGGDNQKAYSEFKYDNYTAAGNHAAVVSNSGMIHYDGSQFSAFAPATQPRGNVTKTTRWLSGGSDIVSYRQYDNAGQVVWSKDPNGNVSTVSYADNFGNGTNPEPGAGVMGPAGATFATATVATNALGHQVKMQYDYSLGAATGVKDANGVITKTEYDSLGRPFRAIAALGLSEQSVSEMSYPTQASNEARVSKQLDATRWLSSKTSFDGFDRPVLAATAEDGLHYNSASYTIFSNTVYDALGRVKLVTNPYRAVAAATDGWSRNTYDLGGRVTEVATFAGGVSSQPPYSGTNSSWTGSITTLYASEATTVTDQAGRKRRSVTDGLGRLVRVDEPDQNNNLDVNGVPVQSTSYSYDTLDNLITVTQGSQPARTFSYDSLKHLISAANPESGTINYQYDNNGNLTQKTDARGVVSSYAYDALNRNLTVNYSDTASLNPDITRIYDTGANGIGRLRESYAGGGETVGTNVEHTKIQSFDALGRPTEQRQRFKTAGVWSPEYKTARAYNIGGGVTSQTYPSGHTVAYVYDNAGRLSGFTGNLGDGANRNYATGIIYSAIGGMTKEQFGTDTPVFNKLAYNSRGQLAEIRAGTSYSGPTDSNWNRGAILNQYSDQCNGPNCNGSDNNGNLKRQETFIPHNDQMSSYTAWYQQYDYDSLNRLQRVKEVNSASATLWQQEYAYDRYGNRSIEQNVTKTWGTGINHRDFAVETATNRLYAPGDLSLAEASRQMQYDQAGNLKKDTYTGAGDRTYDAENRMTSAGTAGISPAVYTYNADGQRVRRKIDNVQTWQVYGMDGELLVEYAANAAYSTPQKEYGYRNGQLLVTAEPAATSTRRNVALAANGAVASASSIYGAGYAAGAVNNGSRSGSTAGNNGNWNDAPPANTFPDWVEVDFNGSKTIDELDVFNLQDNWQNPAEPTEAMTFSQYGLTGYEAQYWNGTGWVDVAGGNLTGNNKIWNKFTFAAVTTTKIRVLTHSSPDGWCRLTEVEAWGTDAGASTANINWLVTDQLGTPRMVFDQTGALANVKRHDYLPFGEELVAGQGGRTSGLGYAPDDGRQRFTSKERDIETGLDYFGARYYASTQGRFTSADPVIVRFSRLNDPQRWNLYGHARENPIKYTDPDGRDLIPTDAPSAAQLRADFDRQMSKAEMANIRVVAGKNVGIVDTSAIDPSTASHAYQGLLQVIQPGVTRNYTSVTANQDVTLADGTTMNVGAGQTVFYGDPKTATQIDIYVPRTDAPQVWGEDGTPIDEPRFLVTAHEIYGESTCGGGQCAVGIENKIRDDLGLPRRSGSDHEALAGEIRPELTIPPTGVNINEGPSPIPIQDVKLPNIVPTMKPILPLIKPPGK